MTERVVTLRPAKEEDKEFLCSVYASTRIHELALTDWPDVQREQFCRMQFEAQDTHYRAHYPTAQYLVIEADGTPAGRLYLDHWSREIRIMDITLLPPYRGKGIGAYLLQDLQGQAEEAQKSLTIHVEKFNPALRLYERLGFRPKQDKEMYLLMEWAGNSQLKAASK
jgi:GNAT superfamily N-acetyltransferase